MESFAFSSPSNNKCCVATCNLNQWALDFDGNLSRIVESIKISKQKGAKYRLGPELEVSGYSCEDHFLELDTYMHCDQSLAKILGSNLTDDILCDIGCPILHNNVRYNCRVFCLNRKIVLIRPKVYLADDGNYREKRFFSSWDHRKLDASGDRAMDDHILSDILRSVTKQETVPIGVGIIKTAETLLAAEMCEELWTSTSPHIDLFLSGVEIIGNGSGSHHELRKLNSRLDLIKSATSKAGGVYLYANQRGCDGCRLYFDGSSMICVNGEFRAQATQFSLNDVEVATAIVDLDDVRTFRGSVNSLMEQSSRAVLSPRQTINIRPFSLRIAQPVVSLSKAPTSPPIAGRIHTPEEECALGPSCWLWDYLRRTKASGVLLPLSGGADSASVATIVFVMCCIVAQACAGIAQDNDESSQQDAPTVNVVVIDDVLRLLDASVSQSDADTVGENDAANSLTVILNLLQQRRNDALFLSQNDQADSHPTLTMSDPVALVTDTVQSTIARSNAVVGAGILTSEQQEILRAALCQSILNTVYMSTVNSSFNTKDRALRLSNSISSRHYHLPVDTVVSAVISVFQTLTGKVPKYETQGGCPRQDIALQNIQARVRMVLAYLCAQLFPWCQGRSGFFLVLGSANVDEALRGYMTKYDCSSADINPIGGMSKGDLKRMMLWASERYSLPALADIANAAPSAELRPIEEGDDNPDQTDYTQTDEEDMGMSYAELGVFGRLRKVLRCGPVRMFIKLTELWTISPLNLSLQEIAVKVKRFFMYYAINRHKLTVLTPSYHAEGYSPDDNRFDLRPFMYNVRWTRQFDTIDAIVRDSDCSALVVK